MGLETTPQLQDVPHAGRVMRFTPASQTQDPDCWSALNSDESDNIVSRRRLTKAAQEPANTFNGR